MKRKVRPLLWTAALVAAIGPAAGQVPAATASVEPTPLPAPAAELDSLGLAIADAYRANPELEAQRAQLRGQDEDVIRAAAPYRLNLSLNSTINYREQRQRNVLDDFAPVELRSLGASLSASQILFNGGRTAAQVSAAEASVLSARERLREVENLILLEVVDSYVSIRRDTEIINIQTRSVDSYTRQVQQAEARERGGDLTRTDIAQARAQLEIVRAQLAQARANLQTSRARFTSVVGRVPGVLIEEAPLPGLPPSLDMAFMTAERESPALWQALMNERSAKAQVAAARAERAPVVSLSGSYGYNNPSSYRIGDLGRNIVGSATFSMPILSGGIIGSRVRAAVAGQQQQEFLVEATRRSVQTTVQNSWNQAVVARDQLGSGEIAVRAAEEALQGVRRGFGEGFRSNFEVIDSEQRLLNAQLLVANARYSRYSSQARLLAVLGQLQAPLIDQAIITYDERENLRRRRNQQFGPFQFFLQAFDKLFELRGDTKPAPIIPPAADARVRPAQVPPPEGPLGTAIPIGALPRTALPDAQVPPPSMTRP